MSTPETDLVLAFSGLGLWMAYVIWTVAPMLRQQWKVRNTLANSERLLMIARAVIMAMFLASAAGFFLMGILLLVNITADVISFNRLKSFPVLIGRICWILAISNLAIIGTCSDWLFRPIQTLFLHLREKWSHS